MFYFLCLLSYLCLSVPVYASSGYGVSLSLQSPLEQESQAGTIITTAILVTNTSDSKETFLWRLSLPEGWLTLPFEEPFMTLEPGETKLELVAIRIPPSAWANTYSVEISIQGQDNPSLLSTEQFLIKVLSRHRIESYIKKAPAYALAGESYDIEIGIANLGNEKNTLSLKATDPDHGTIVFFTPEIPLDPGEKKSAFVTVKTFPTITQATDQIVCLTLQDSQGNSYTLIVQVELFPKNTPPTSAYHTLPMKTTWGYGMKNGKKQLFLEQYGDGPLSPQKRIDFFIRAPFLNQVNVDRDLGGLPENGYFHYCDPLLDLYAGDGVYTLTPLTMLNRFGRGASLSLEPNKVFLKGLYLQDTSSNPESVWGAEAGCRPISPLRICLTSILTHQSKQKLSNSIFSEWNQPGKIDASLEYAHTNNHKAYYLYAHGTPTQNVWYALQKIYAGTNFVGYYQNTDQLYASIGFPIIERLQGTLSYNFTKYNLDTPSSTRNHNAYGGLSYSFSCGLYTSCIYNFLSSRNSTSNPGYNTHFVSLNGGQSFGNWTLQGIVECGTYHGHIVSANHLWQSYQLYTYYQPSARQQYAIYSRIGYVQISDQVQWTRIYGISSSWSHFKSLSSQILYELTDQENARHYINAKIKYQFPNESFLELQGYRNQSGQDPSVLEFLVTYTIPWKLPFRKNRSEGTIKGTISHADHPPSSLIVNCNGMRTLTNAKGEFFFPSLTPGTYNIWTEEKSQVSHTPFPLSVQVSGGESSHVHIHFDTPSSLKGTLPLFAFFQEELEQTGFLTNALVCLTSAESSKNLVTTTDSQGTFTFDKIAPGRWFLTLQTEDLPPYCRFESKELLLDIFPGEQKSISIKVLPVQRQMRMIDSGSL